MGCFCTLISTERIRHGYLNHYCFTRCRMAYLFSMKHLIKNIVIRRIVYLIVGSLFYALIGFFQDANAEETKTYVLYEYAGGGVFTDQTQACNSAGQYRATLFSGTLTSVDSCGFSGGGVTGQQLFAQFTITYGSNTAQTADNWAAVYTCTAPQIYNPENSSCEDPPQPCEDGLVTHQGTYHTYQTASVSTTGCLNQCEVIVTKSLPKKECWGAAVNGVTPVCFNKQDLKYTQTGESCNTTTPPPEQLPDPAPENPESPERDCLEKGKNFGYVNGTVACVPKGTEGSEGADKQPITEEKTTNNPDGSTTKTTTTTTENGDGTITTETTTETTPSGGGSPTTETTTEEQDFGGFCEENPNSKICEEGEEGSFGGSCNSAFTCEGDAVQCAIAKDQHKRNCEFFDNETSFSNLGESLVNGSDTFANPVDAENRETFDLTTSIDEGAGIGGGTLQDKSIPLMGRNIVLPFSQLNWVFQLLGMFILAGAYINAARIVGVR